MAVDARDGKIGLAEISTKLPKKKSGLQFDIRNDQDDRAKS
jgi:hypothetical protein